MKKSIAIFCLLFLMGPLFGASEGEVIERFDVKDGFFQISVTVRAPIPTEISNETQALAISKDAAVAIAQAHLLSHVLKKKTKSGKTLEEAEIPSLELQEKVRGTIKGAKIEWTKWKEGYCWVKMTLSKKKIKSILKEN